MSSHIDNTVTGFEAKWMALAVLLALLSLPISSTDNIPLTAALYILLFVSEFFISGFAFIYLIIGILLFQKAFSYVSLNIGLDIYIAEYVIAIYILKIILGYFTTKERPLSGKWLLFAPYLVLGFALALSGIFDYGIIAIRQSAIFYYSIISLICLWLVKAEEHIYRLLVLVFILSLAGQVIVLLDAYSILSIDKVSVGVVHTNIISIVSYFSLKKRFKILNTFKGHLILLIPFTHAVCFAKSTLYLAYLSILILYLIYRYILARKIKRNKKEVLKQLLYVTAIVVISVILGHIMSPPSHSSFFSELRAFVNPFPVSSTATNKSSDLNKGSPQKSIEGKQGSGAATHKSNNSNKQLQRKISDEEKVQGQQNNALWRIVVWEEAIKKGLKNPIFGMGFGPIFIASEGLQEHGFVHADAPDPHNSYIAIFMRMGAVGIIFFFLIIIPIFISGVGRYFKSNPNENNNLGPLVGVWIGLAVSAAVNVVLENSFGAVPFWTMIGLMAATAGMSRSKKPTSLFIGPLPPPVHGVSVLQKSLIESDLKEKYDLRVLDTADRSTKACNTIGKFTLGNVLSALWTSLRLCQKMICFRPKVIYLFISQNRWGFLRDSVLIRIGTLFGAKVVANLAGSLFRDFYNSCPKGRQKRIKRALNRISLVEVLGSKLRPIFEGLVPADRIVVTPNGVRIENYENIASERFVRKPGRSILFMSTLRNSKGLGDLINAFDICAAAFQDTRLIIAGNWGTQPDKEPVIDILEKCGFKDRIDFLGVVTGGEKLETLKTADVFCLPSWSEGQPVAILEAMAAGLPVITCDRGVITDMIIDGKGGFIVPPKQPQAIAEKLELLFRSPELMLEQGKFNLERVREHFSFEKYIEKVADDINRALGMSRLPVSVPRLNNH
jgi:glycosyltransferase involved in cell wall biosynthesis